MKRYGLVDIGHKGLKGNAGVDTGQPYLTKLTRCSRVVLEQLTFPQLIKIFPYFMQPEVHYRVHKRIPLATSLIQMNSGHALPSYLFKIPFNIILQSSPTSPKLPLTSGRTTKTLYAYFCPSFDPNTRQRGFRLPATVQLRPSLFWDVIKRRLVVS